MCVCVCVCESEELFAGTELGGVSDGRESPNCVFVAASENENAGCRPDILSQALRVVADQMYARHLGGHVVPGREDGPACKTMYRT